MLKLTDAHNMSEHIQVSPAALKSGSIVKREFEIFWTRIRNFGFHSE